MWNSEGSIWRNGVEIDCVFCIIFGDFALTTFFTSTESIYHIYVCASSRKYGGDAHMSLFGVIMN